MFIILYKIHITGYIKKIELLYFCLKMDLLEIVQMINGTIFLSILLIDQMSRLCEEAPPIGKVARLLASCSSWCLSCSINNAKDASSSSLGPCIKGAEKLLQLMLRFVYCCLYKGSFSGLSTFLMEKYCPSAWKRFIHKRFH